MLHNAQWMMDGARWTNPFIKLVPPLLLLGTSPSHSSRNAPRCHCLEGPLPNGSQRRPIPKIGQNDSSITPHTSNTCLPALENIPTNAQATPWPRPSDSTSPHSENMPATEYKQVHRCQIHLNDRTWFYMLTITSSSLSPCCPWPQKVACRHIDARPRGRGEGACTPRSQQRS